MVGKINLKQRRIELGLTMKDVANAVGVSESTVSRWEAGNIVNMKRNRLVALANVLQIPVNELINDNTSITNEIKIPQVRVIQRAMNNLNEEERNRMVEILRLSFKDAFEEDDDD